MSILSLVDAKNQLNIQNADEDTALQSYLDAVDLVIEAHTGQIVTPRDFTEELYLPAFTSRVRLHNTPLLSVTSLTDAVNGTLYNLTSAVVRQVGLVILPTGIRGDWTVTYHSGLTAVPVNYVRAAAIIVQHLWQTRRGRMPSASDDLMSSFEVTNRTGLLAGYAIPNAAIELLGAAAPAVA